MKDKIKARFAKLKEAHPFETGIAIGGAVGIGTTVAIAVALKANFDAHGVYIPDHIIEQMRLTGEPILGVKDGAKVVFDLLPTE